MVEALLVAAAILALVSLIIARGKTIDGWSLLLLCIALLLERGLLPGA